MAVSVEPETRYGKLVGGTQMPPRDVACYNFDIHSLVQRCRIWVCVTGCDNSNNNNNNYCDNVYGVIIMTKVIA